jgi:hypothetical protein
MDLKLQHAVDLLWHWLPREDGSKFWPKEETLQGWFAACLVESGYASHPTQVLQELHLGEAKAYSGWDEFEDKFRPHMPKIPRGGKHCWQFDLTVTEAVLEDRGRPARFRPGVRDLETLHPAPKLLVEIKALNSAGTLQPISLKGDFDKLQFAQRYLERDGRSVVDALLLVVATDCKDCTETEARHFQSKVESISRHIETLRMPGPSPKPRGELMIEPIYRDRPTALAEYHPEFECPQCARHSGRLGI